MAGAGRSREEEREYVEDSEEEEEPWPRLPVFTSKEREAPRVPHKEMGIARGFKPAPAKFVIKREPPLQSLGAAQAPGSALKQLLSVPKKRERAEMEAIEESDSQEDFPPSHAAPHKPTPIPPEADEKPPDSAGPTIPAPNRTVFGNYGSGERDAGGGGATPAPRPHGGAMGPRATVGKTGVYATPSGVQPRGLAAAEGPGVGTPVSAQRQFLASVLPTVGTAPMPSSAVKVSPKKGLGPLGGQLRRVLQEQDRVAPGGQCLTLRVQSAAMDGAILRAVCQPDPGQGGDGRLAEIVLLLRTEPRLDVAPGDRVCVRQPWQAMDVGGARVLLARHAFVVDLGG